MTSYQHPVFSQVRHRRVYNVPVSNGLTFSLLRSLTLSLHLQPSRENSVVDLRMCSGENGDLPASLVPLLSFCLRSALSPEEVRHAYGRARNSVSRIVSEHGKSNVATALEVRFCTSRVELTRACRSTILGLWIVEKGLYCSCVSVELRSDNFAERAG